MITFRALLAYGEIILLPPSEAKITPIGNEKRNLKHLSFAEAWLGTRFDSTLIEPLGNKSWTIEVTAGY